MKTINPRYVLIIGIIVVGFIWLSNSDWLHTVTNNAKEEDYRDITREEAICRTFYTKTRESVGSSITDIELDILCTECDREEDPLCGISQ